MVYTIIQHLTAKDSPDAIDKLKSKLVEASAVFGKDRETLAWIPMQDAVDRRRFTVVERYRDESVSVIFWVLFERGGEMGEGGRGKRGEGRGERMKADK